MLKKSALGFFDFIREQGVVGLAIGFILGGSVSELVKSLVNDILQPLIGLLLGSTDGLQDASVSIFGAQVLYGNFLSLLINFFLIAAVVYFVFKGLKLEALDKKKK